MVARAWGGVMGWVLFNGYRVSVSHNVRVMKTDGGYAFNNTELYCVSVKNG